jgi:hypothetical protein
LKSLNSPPPESLKGIIYVSSTRMTGAIVAYPSREKRCCNDRTAARMLITTRLINLRFLRGYQPLDLPLFTEGQCFELFCKIIGKEEVKKHEAEARSLFECLG